MVPDCSLTLRVLQPGSDPLLSAECDCTDVAGEVCLSAGSSGKSRTHKHGSPQSLPRLLALMMSRSLQVLWPSQRALLQAAAGVPGAV